MQNSPQRLSRRLVSRAQKASRSKMLCARMSLKQLPHREPPLKNYITLPLSLHAITIQWIIRGPPVPTFCSSQNELAIVLLFSRFKRIAPPCEGRIPF
eukprot:4163707-Amphidinium_carterae.1